MNIQRQQKIEKLIKDIGTKKRNSRTQKILIKRLEKQWKKQHWHRLNKAREYPISLMKVFKNRLLKLIKK